MNTRNSAWILPALALAGMVAHAGYVSWTGGGETEAWADAGNWG